MTEFKYGITAEVIEDSISETGVRLISIHVKYPRIIHAEVMTHRVFSRNGRSSRAAPVATFLKESVFWPMFQKNKPGMQSTESLSHNQNDLANLIWWWMSKTCRMGSWILSKIGVHKQWANRPLEWFGYIDVLITATEWENFFDLRLHKDAQPEIKELAEAMLDAINKSVPAILRSGEWHLPFVSYEERNIYKIADLQKLSVARCARISYKPFDGNANIEKEFDRYDKLVTSQPIHASPAEHQGTPLSDDLDWAQGNFKGWVQYRKLIELLGNKFVPKPHMKQYDIADLKYRYDLEGQPKWDPKNVDLN